MTRGQRWSIGAIFVVCEGLIIWTHPQQAKAMMRTVYETLWAIAPKPDGYEPPKRFQ